MSASRFTEEYALTLQKWVDMPTPTTDRERLNAFLDSLREAFCFSGAEICEKETPNGRILHISVGNGEKRALLLGHADTVFPADAYEKFDTENARAYGAGVLDMKTGLFMMKKIMERFAASPVPDWRLECVITPDEESGSIESREYLLRASEGARFALVFEGAPKGYVTVARKGIYRFKINIKGVAGHASGGDKNRKSAVYAMNRILTGIYSLETDDDTTIHVGIVRGGSAVNVVAQSAVIEGEIRSFDPDALENTIERIGRLLDGEREKLQIVNKRPPMPMSEKTEKLFEIARRSAEKAGIRVQKRFASGGSDGAFPAQKGVAVLDGMGPEGMRAHTRREYVEMDSIEARLEMAYQTLKCAMELDFR